MLYSLAVAEEVEVPQWLMTLLKFAHRSDVDELAQPSKDVGNA